MKLRFIEKTTPSRGRLSKVSFTKHGYLSFNQSAIQEYGLKAGQGVGLFQDEDKPKDFYLILSNDERFPKLRLSGKSILMTGYSSARKSLMEQFKLPDQGICVRLGGQVKTELGSAICLITASLSDKKEVPNG